MRDMVHDDFLGVENMWRTGVGGDKAANGSLARLRLDPRMLVVNSGVLDPSVMAA